jgi:phosphoserine phosphatase
MAKTAAFFRVEGTLLEPGAVQAIAYLAGNRQGFRERFFRLGQVAVTAPASKIFGLRVLALALKGMSEDRIAVIGREFFEDVLAKDLMPEGLGLIEKARSEGHEIVLLSEEINEVISPVTSRIPNVRLVSNRLEYENGKATGKLLDPVIGTFESDRWLKEFAASERIDLSGSQLYAGQGPDLFLLSGVGRPYAVNPNFRVRRAARVAKWPVLEYRG